MWLSVGAGVCVEERGGVVDLGQAAERDKEGVAEDHGLPAVLGLLGHRAWRRRAPQER